MSRYPWQEGQPLSISDTRGKIIIFKIYKIHDCHPPGSSQPPYWRGRAGLFSHSVFKRLLRTFTPGEGCWAEAQAFPVWVPTQSSLAQSSGRGMRWEAWGFLYLAPVSPSHNLRTASFFYKGPGRKYLWLCRVTYCLWCIFYSSLIFFLQSFENVRAILSLRGWTKNRRQADVAYCGPHFSDLWPKEEAATFLLGPPQTAPCHTSSQFTYVASFADFIY